MERTQIKMNHVNERKTSEMTLSYSLVKKKIQCFCTPSRYLRWNYMSLNFLLTTEQWFSLLLLTQCSHSPDHGPHCAWPHPSTLWTIPQAHSPQAQLSYGNAESLVGLQSAQMEAALALMSFTNTQGPSHLLSRGHRENQRGFNAHGWQRVETKRLSLLESPDSENCSFVLIAWSFPKIPFFEIITKVCP